MDTQLKHDFLERWGKYFPNAELPIVFYYTDDPKRAEQSKSGDAFCCIVADLAKVRRGKSIRFDVTAIGCGGARRYLGFSQDLGPNFEHFLSCGIPGEVEGERYKKSPELVKKLMASHTPLQAPGKYIVFKRWDMIDQTDEPVVAIFFAAPDVLSGLFTLANFDETDPNAVITPFCSGCASIVQYPYQESNSQHPRAVLGMFDVSARPCVPSERLTFAVPCSKLARMVDNMDESFLITKSWSKVRSRIEKDGQHSPA